MAPTNVAVSSGFFLPATSGWVTATFDIGPADLIALLGSVNAALGNTTALRTGRAWRDHLGGSDPAACPDLGLRRAMTVQCRGQPAARRRLDDCAARSTVARPAFTIGLICIASVAIASAQRGQGPPLPPIPSGQPAPQFRASIDIVHLDVSVLDRDRRPVRGLVPADFTILENGVPQQVSVFSAVDIPDTFTTPVEWVREIAADVTSNERIEERRLFLLLIDDAMIQSDVEALKNTKRIAHQVIDRLGPSDLAAVIFTLNNRNSQDYTSDRARLRAAVEKFGPGFRDMSTIAGDDLYWNYSADVVRRAVEMLRTLPDRRKSMIYIGQGLPVNLELLAAPQAPGLPESGGASAISQQGLMGRIQQLMAKAFAAAAEGNVNVYPVDVCGLRVEKPPAPSTPGGIPPPPPTCQPGLEIDYLLTVASNTNARAVINTSDFEPGIQAIFDENGSYYLLGYQPANTAQDGRFRRVDVRVNRPGVEVRTRSGYRPESARDIERRKAELAKEPLGAALAGVVPRGGVPLQAMAAAFPRAPRSESAVAIVLGVRQPIRPSAERTIEKVDLQVSAYNVDGKFFGSKRMQADVAIRGGATGLATYEVLSSLELKPGRYQLRMAAHVGSLGASGSLYVDVDVPDLSKAPVTLSGVVLTSSPSPVVAPANALKDFLPVVPTTERGFSRGDAVAAFMRVHQGGRRAVTAAALRVAIRDSQDVDVMDRGLTIPAESFTGDRAADVRIDLPINRLPAGAYLLTIETGTGKDAMRRDVRFEVR